MKGNQPQGARWRHAGLTAAAVGLALALSGCGNDPSTGGGARAAIGMAKEYGTLALSRLKGEDPAAAAGGGSDIQTVISNALRNNEGPLIMTLIESHGGYAILGVSGENGPYRTWLTASLESLTFKSGVLSSSRGLGHDLMSSQADGSIALIKAREAGQSRRDYQFLNGLGQTEWLTLQCEISRSEKTQEVEFGEVKTDATVMAEVCTRDTFKVENLYWVDSKGRIVKSRQWLSPRVGYVTVQIMRL